MFHISMFTVFLIVASNAASGAVFNQFSDAPTVDADGVDCRTYYSVDKERGLLSSQCVKWCSTFVGKVTDISKDPNYLLFRRQCRSGGYIQDSRIVALNGLWNQFYLGLSSANWDWDSEEGVNPSICQAKCELSDTCEMWGYSDRSCVYFNETFISDVLLPPELSSFCGNNDTEVLFENDICLDRGITCIKHDEEKITGFPFGRAEKSKCLTPNPKYPPLFNTDEDWAKVNVNPDNDISPVAPNATIDDACSNVASVDDSITYDTWWCQKLCRDLLANAEVEVEKLYPYAFHMPFNRFCIDVSTPPTSSGTDAVTISQPFITGFVPKNANFTETAITAAQCKGLCEVSSTCDFWTWSAKKMCAMMTFDDFAESFYSVCDDGVDVCGDGTNRCFTYPLNAVSGWKNGRSTHVDMCPEGNNEFLFPYDTTGDYSTSTTKAPSASSGSKTPKVAS